MLNVQIFELVFYTIFYSTLHSPKQATHSSRLAAVPPFSMRLSALRMLRKPPRPPAPRTTRPPAPRASQRRAPRGGVARIAAFELKALQMKRSPGTPSRRDIDGVDRAGKRYWGGSETRKTSSGHGSSLIFIIFKNGRSKPHISHTVGPRGEDPLFVNRL